MRALRAPARCFEGVAVGGLLKGVSKIPWGEMRDAQQDPAGGIPPLLSRIAYGDEQAARLAVDALGDVVCAMGFVVGQATSPTVPFILELAGAPHTPCKSELLDLLKSICRTEQWHSAAAAAIYQEQCGWEAAARAAVLLGRSVVEGLASSLRPEEAAPARELLWVIDALSPFPQL
ncbi:hypothetical protein ABZ883_08085 [Streptomyces sp. NPDC046977]|uniref:hypothetical protein n=1 Tax=Streptomyces sp. NPDC046977 TaxID=3154703 RepID=UPI003411CEE3